MIWSLGKAAERWLSGFSWVALLVAIVVGVVTTLVIRRRTNKAMQQDYAEESADEPSLQTTPVDGPPTSGI